MLTKTTSLKSLKWKMWLNKFALWCATASWGTSTVVLEDQFKVLVLGPQILVLVLRPKVLVLGPQSPGKLSRSLQSVRYDHMKFINSVTACACPQKVLIPVLVLRPQVLDSLSSNHKFLSLDHTSPFLCPQTTSPWLLVLVLRPKSLSSDHKSLFLYSDHKSLTLDHKSFSLSWNHKSLSLEPEVLNCTTTLV